MTAAEKARLIRSALRVAYNDSADRGRDFEILTVAEARRRKAKADAEFEVKLATAREKLERKLIVNELVRREKERA